MRTITATELARNLRQVLDRLIIDGEEIEIERNNQRIARLIPGAGKQTAMEAMSDLYRTLSPDAAAGWVEQSRKGVDSRIDEGVRDPWGS